MKVAIATNSVDKINGIKQAFSRFFKTEIIEVVHQSVDSGVPEQPFDSYVYQGAINRVNALKNSLDTEDVDFYVSCEAGIEESIGIFFNVQIVCVFDAKSQTYTFGKSTGWQVPSKDIEKIRKTNLDTYLREHGINKLEDLLENNWSRAESISQATEMALCSMKLC